MAYGPGDLFAGYAIERLLGKGGMGSVYLAKHPRLPRRDALKLLSPYLFEDETYRARFEREADLAASLSHRNVVAVYDRGSENGQLWIAMQYVEGIDAAQALDGGKPMHAQRAAHIVAEAATGLDFAHRHGLVHRDVKPANILLSPGVEKEDAETVMLADFGIAKSSKDSLSLTGTGVFLGTMSYAAPELLDGRPADHRVDVYSLGCVLFELLTGRVPFPVPSPLAAINAHLTTPPPTPSSVTFGVPEALDAVVLKAMAKNPDDRYPTARDMAAAIRAAIPAAGPARPSSGTLKLGADTPRPPYTITVRRFTDPSDGVQLGPIDTAQISEGERSALETLLYHSAFFELPLRMPLVRQVPGDQYVELTVSGGGHERTVGYEQAGSRVPIEFTSIIDRLANLAPWQRAGAGPSLGNPRTHSFALDHGAGAPTVERPWRPAEPADPRPATGTTRPATGQTRPATGATRPQAPQPLAPQPTRAVPTTGQFAPQPGAAQPTVAQQRPRPAAGPPTGNPTIAGPGQQVRPLTGPHPQPAPTGPQQVSRAAPGTGPGSAQAWWNGPPLYLAIIGLIASVPFYLWSVIAGLIVTVVVLGGAAILAVLRRS